MRRVNRFTSLIALAWGEAAHSLRLNLIPGLLLQGVMATVAAAYLLSPRAHHLLMHLGALKEEWGLVFSFVGTSAASSLLPELLRPLLPQSARLAQPPLLSRLLFAIPFWGLIGMQVDLFYRLQFLLFGPSDSLSVIAGKVLVDAFLYCPLLAIPEAVCIILWRDHGFSRRGFHGWTPSVSTHCGFFPS